MTKRDCRDYLQDIIDSVNDIADFTKGYDFEYFSKDRKTVNAVIKKCWCCWRGGQKGSQIY